jgi:hypothetical protein
MCCSEYIGIFCTDQNPPKSVFGFVTFHNGVPSYKYFDTVTNEEYIGFVNTNCSDLETWATD